MEKLTTGYAKYFNTKYARVGSLFQDSFKAEHVDKDNYLRYLFAYIHLNPIKLIEPRWREDGIRHLHKAKKYLSVYSYSSYQDYTGKKREEGRILSKDAFPDYFGEEREFKSFIVDLLEYA